jgi:tetraacyldisaccharide 4'-kinase
VTIPPGLTARARAALDSVAPTLADRLWRAVLSAAAAGYRVGVTARRWSFDAGVRGARRLPVPVICVGNLTVGGTGKTPATIAVVHRLRGLGLAVGVLLRGYGRDGEGVKEAADPAGHRAPWRQVGDEAALLAGRLPGVPVIVGADRFRAGQEALRRFPLDTLVLDDGFQHRQLHRDLDLVMVDATDPLGGGHLLPRGRLREPASALRRASALLLSRSDQAQDPGEVRRMLLRVAPGIPQILTCHRPSRLTDLEGPGTHAPGLVRGRRVLAVSGIARPAAFHDTLATLGATLAGRLSFPDHHPYGRSDLDAIARAADAARAEWIVTTEKDAVRLREVAAARPERYPILVLGVELEVTEGEEILDRLLRQCVRGSGAAQSR